MVIARPIKYSIVGTWRHNYGHAVDHNCTSGHNRWCIQLWEGWHYGHYTVTRIVRVSIMGGGYSYGQDYHYGHSQTWKIL